MYERGGKSRLCSDKCAYNGLRLLWCIDESMRASLFVAENPSLRQKCDFILRRTLIAKAVALYRENLSFDIFLSDKVRAVEDRRTFGAVPERFFQIVYY